MRDKDVSNLVYAGVIVAGLAAVVGTGIAIKSIATNIFNPVSNALEDATIQDNSKCDTARSRVDPLFARRHGCQLGN